jgi:nucleoside phosphorylase
VHHTGGPGPDGGTLRRTAPGAWNTAAGAVGLARRPVLRQDLLMPSLLLAAFPPELAGLDRSPPAGWIAAVTGVGALTAALETARLVAAHRPERVLFVGTCGALDDRLHVGDVVSAAEAIATSVEERAARAYRPEIEQVRWPATWPLPFPAHAVAVPPAITRTEEGARALAGVAAAEHLELTGVFAACHAAGVPVAAALAVANRVGPGAHAEWLARHAAASAALLEALRAAGVLAA